MQQITINQSSFFTREEIKDTRATVNSLKVRNNREHLIDQIVNRTDEKNKKNLAKLLAIASYRFKWQDIDLHALLKKADDPSIRNYTAFVKWSIKDKAL
jgi:hypothetical protein